MTSPASSGDLEVVILVGLQASGKSSFYRARFATTHVLVSKDLFPSARNKAARQRREIESALSAGRSVVVDNTNVTPEHRAEIAVQARLFGARVVCFFFQTTAQECLARNARRTGKARVPDVAIRVAAARLEPPKVAEGFDALWLVRLSGDGGFLITPA